MRGFMCSTCACLFVAVFSAASGEALASRSLQFYSIQRFVGRPKGPPGGEKMELEPPVVSPSPTSPATTTPSSSTPSVPKPKPRAPRESDQGLDECACAEDGVSGGVSTGRLGCYEHTKGSGEGGLFCMVVGGVACADAKESFAFPGAAWKSCTTENGQLQVDHPCTCSSNGVSGGVSTGRSGCKEHVPNSFPFCMVVGGAECTSAKASKDYPGASWRDCGTA